MKIFLYLLVILSSCLYYIFLGPFPLWLLFSLLGLAYIIIIKKAAWVTLVYNDNKVIIIGWLLFSVYSFFRDYLGSSGAFDAGIMLNIFTLVLFLFGLLISFRNSLKSFIFIFAIAILIQSIVAIFQAMGNKFAWSIPDILNFASKGVETKYTIEGKEEFGGRVRGLSTFIHIFSPLIASASIFFFILVRERIILFTKKEKIFYNIIAGVSLLAMVLTFSRSVIISGGGIIFISLFFSKATGWAKFRNIVLLIFTLVVVVVVVTNEKIEAYNRITDFGSQYNSDQRRFGSYYYAGQLISQNLFFGVSSFGTEDFEVAIHSVPLKTMAAYGVVGFLFYLVTIVSFIGKIVKGITQNRNSALKKYSLIVGCWLFVCLVDSTFHTSGILSKNIYEMGIAGALLGNFSRIKKYGAI